MTPIGREIGLVERSSLVDVHRPARSDFGRGRRCSAKLRAEDILRRPETDWSEVTARWPALSAIDPAIAVLLQIRAKYEGYIARQDRDIERFAKLESKLIPAATDYLRVVGLRNEAKQKLAKFTPRSLGQALRISGITPADVTVLAIHLDRR